MCWCCRCAFVVPPHLFNAQGLQASGLYVTSSFYMGRSMAELPLHLLWGFLVGVITYTMMGFQEDWGRFWIYVLNMVLITNTGVAFLLFVGTISRDMAQGNLIGTCHRAAVATTTLC